MNQPRLGFSLVTLGLCLCGASAAALADKPAAYSQLPDTVRARIEQRIEPPPTAERDAPYSTPMYYLLQEGFADGPNNELLLDRHRPDWQEVLMRDWAELGLTSTLFGTTPKELDDERFRAAFDAYLALSKKYGLGVGIRLMGDETLQGIEAEGWEVHPRNPENRIDEYVAWVRRVAELGKGRADHYIVGDEVNRPGWEKSAGDGTTIRGETEEDKRWRPEDYMAIFTRISEAIKSVDPDAKVSMFGMNGLDLKYVQELMKLGYADHADGVAANIDFFRGSPRELEDFVNGVKADMPDARFYSNGVGYVGARDTNFYPANLIDAYAKRLSSDEDQAHLVAKVMYLSFVYGWDSAPYYIIVRQWALPDGRFAPHWYGFFGFVDLVVDDSDQLTVKHYPAWNAVQTIAHVFHDKAATNKAEFDAKPSRKVAHHWTFTRNDYECLVVLWQEKEEDAVTTDIELPVDRYAFPVRVSMQNWREATDLDYRLTDGGLVIENVRVGVEPVVIRLVAEEQP